MVHVRVCNVRTRLNLKCKYALVSCLNNQVDLTASVVGAAVVNPRLGGLCIDTDGLSYERLEHLAEERSISGRGIRRRYRHEFRAGGNAAE